MHVLELATKSIVDEIVRRAEDDNMQVTLHQGRCREQNKTAPYNNKVLIRNSMKNPRKTCKNLQKDLIASNVNVLSSAV